MTGSQRCDEIIRLIDQILAENEIAAVRVSPPRTSPAQIGPCRGPQ